VLAVDSPYIFERGFPAAGTAERAYAAADLRRAIEAYKFFYPVVATEAVMQKGLAAGAMVNEARHCYGHRAITAELVIPNDGAKGVILAQGGMFGGWSIYVKNGHPRATPRQRAFQQVRRQLASGFS